jgi:hypothetical protein
VTPYQSGQEPNQMPRFVFGTVKQMKPHTLCHVVTQVVHTSAVFWPDLKRTVVAVYSTCTVVSNSVSVFREYHDMINKLFIQPRLLLHLSLWDLQSKQHLLNCWEITPHCLWNLPVFDNNSINTGLIANLTAGGERMSKTTLSTYWSCLGTIPTYMLNWRHNCSLQMPFVWWQNWPISNRSDFSCGKTHSNVQVSCGSRTGTGTEPGFWTCC